MEPRILKSKALHILKENDDILKYLVEQEMRKVSDTKIEASSEFELTKKYYQNEGIKEGLRRFMQRLNEWASKDI